MPASSVRTVEPLSGPYTTLQGLIDNKRAAESLLLQLPRRASRQLAGAYRSRLKGRGMEFEDVRGYQPGDDVRNIDWRVTARTTVTHTKTFTEERERPVIICCDQRGSMFFGSRCRFKSVQAANVASLLAWSALKRKDRVGGMVLGVDTVLECRAQNSQKAVLKLLASIDQLNHRLQRDAICGPPGLHLTEALADLRRITQTGTTVFIISDFHDLDDDGLRQLYELSRHNSVACIAIHDPLERELPGRGQYAVSNGERELQIDTSSRRLRDRFADDARQRADLQRADLVRLGIPQVEIATTDNALDTLSALFQRSRRRTTIA